jgi:hypothetical protein
LFIPSSPDDELFGTWNIFFSLWYSKFLAIVS